MVMRISLIVSFLCHVFMVLVFQEAFPSPWAQWEFRTYQVDMLRPPVEKINEEDIPVPDFARLKKEHPVPPADEAATISLDTKDKRYISYANALKERIMGNWDYPLQARRNRMEGKLMLLFSLTRSGNLTHLEIKRRSGHELLDKEAVRAIHVSAPFPSFPEHITVQRLHIKASFDYRLKARK